MVNYDLYKHKTAMPTITYHPRTGKDLLEFNKRSLIDTKLAQDWAIEEFTMIDGEPLDIIKISQLTDKSYLMIFSKIFTPDSSEIIDDSEGIVYKDWHVIENDISKNLITKLLTTDRKDYVKLLVNTMSEIYNVSEKDINEMPYQLVSYMIQKINIFLSELANPRESFDIAENDLFRTTPTSTNG